METAASTVYKPAEDTFLMLDALQLDLEHIVNERLVCQNRAVADTSSKGGPLLVVELGCGAGLLTAAVGKALRDCEAYAGAHCLAVDINPAACHVTSQTCQLNGIQVCFLSDCVIYRKLILILLCVLDVGRHCLWRLTNMDEAF